MSQIEQPDPDVANLSYKERADEITRLRAELAAATGNEPTSTVEPPAPTSRIAQLVAKPDVTVETPEDGQQVATHAIAPGSAGDDVRLLATLLEKAGEPTYLSDPRAQNHAHTFDDALLASVRRVLYTHPEIANAEGAEGDAVKRWIRDLEIVGADVWALLEEIAASESTVNTVEGATTT